MGQGVAGDAVWDRLMAVGRPFALRPAGHAAARHGPPRSGADPHRGRLHLATQALVPAQNYSPFEIGLGRLVNLDKEADFVGERALIAERDDGGAARWLAYGRLGID